MSVDAPRAARSAAERHRVYSTQARGIEAGEKYADTWDEMGQWLSDTYGQVLDAQIGKFINSYVDPVTGKKISTTLAERRDPALRDKVQGLRAKISAAVK